MWGVPIVKSNLTLLPPALRTLLLLFVGLSSLALAREAPPSIAAAAEAIPHFDVLEFQVEGNSRLPEIEVERLVYPFMGEDKTIEDVERARVALEQAYQRAGYSTVLVDVPEQKVQSGVVRLRVTEGKVAELRVTGSRYFDRGEIRRRVPELAVGSVPLFPEVQRQLGEVNRTPDRQVTPVLKAGATPGTVDVELRVEDKLPLHGGLELNNRASPDTRALRLSGQIQYDNLWQAEHSASLRYQTTPADLTQVRTLSGTYVVPVPHTANAIAFYAVRSRSAVATLGDLNVLGNGNIYGVRAIFNAQPVGDVNGTFTLGADYKDFTSTVAVPGQAGDVTPIRYVPLLAQVQLSHAGEKSTTSATFGASFAPRHLLGNNDADFNNNRFNSDSSWFHLRTDLQYEQHLSREFVVVAAVNGQFSSRPLISNEQFVAGGADSVRGYLEAEAIGDIGLRAKLELRTPSRGLGLGTANGYALVFVDGARLRVLDPIAPQQYSFSLLSTGVGLRLKPSTGFTLGLDLAHVLEDGVRTTANTNRLLFQLAYEF